MPSKHSILVAAAAASVLQGANAQLFTVNCSPLTIQRGDPIVSPGQISGHVHIVTGGTNFALTETNEDARNAKATTCDKLLDKSNYWQPQLVRTLFLILEREKFLTFLQYHQRHDQKFELVTMQGNVSSTTMSLKPSYDFINSVD